MTLVLAPYHKFTRWHFTASYARFLSSTYSYATAPSRIARAIITHVTLAYAARACAIWFQRLAITAPTTAAYNARLRSRALRFCLVLRLSSLALSRNNIAYRAALSHNAPHNARMHSVRAWVRKTRNKQAQTLIVCSFYMVSSHTAYCYNASILARLPHITRASRSFSSHATPRLPSLASRRAVIMYSFRACVYCCAAITHARHTDGALHRHHCSHNASTSSSSWTYNAMRNARTHALYLHARADIVCTQFLLVRTHHYLTFTGYCAHTRLFTTTHHTYGSTVQDTFTAFCWTAHLRTALPFSFLYLPVAAVGPHSVDVEV